MPRNDPKRAVAEPGLIDCDLDRLVSGTHHLRRRWQDITVDYAWLPPWEGSTEPRPNRVKVVFSGHQCVALEHEGKLNEVTVHPGGSYLVGADATCLVRVAEWSDTLDMYPDLDLLAREAEEQGFDAFTIVSTLRDGTRVFKIDPTFLGLAHRFRAACLGQIQLSDIQASTLACRLVSRILDTHARYRHGSGFRHRLYRVSLVRACEFVEAHLGSELSLRAIADQCHLSVFHFARGFKVETGLSPGQFVIHRRVELAKRLLLTTEAPVEEIAHRAGYQNVRHFRRQFRSSVGALPGDLRASVRRVGNAADQTMHN